MIYKNLSIIKAYNNVNKISLESRFKSKSLDIQITHEINP